MVVTSVSAIFRFAVLPRYRFDIAPALSRLSHSRSAALAQWGDRMILVGRLGAAIGRSARLLGASPRVAIHKYSQVIISMVTTSY